MLSRLCRAVAPPSYERPEDARLAWLLCAVSWGVAVTTVVWGAVRAVSDAGRSWATAGDALLALLLVAGPCASLILMRSGRLRQAVFLLVSVLYAGFTLTIGFAGGVRTPASGLYVLLVAVAAALLGSALGGVVAMVATLTALGFVYAEALGWLAHVPSDPLRAWGAVAAIGLATGAIVALSDRGRRAEIAAMRDEAEGLRSQVEQLRETGRARTAALDRQIRYLSAVTSVSRDIASLTDVTTLLPRAVSLLADRLGLHHVGIYVLDDRAEWLDLAASADPEAEDSRLLWEPRVQSDASTLVGRVAATGNYYLAPDAERMGQEEEGSRSGGTRARLVLPIVHESRVLGVLDLHSRVEGTFQPDDAGVFATLADLIGAALANAAAFQEARQRSEALRAVYGQSVADAWRQVLLTRPPLGVERTAQGLVAARGEWRKEMRAVVRTGRTVVSGEGERSVALPVSVRGQVIAVLDASKPADTSGWSRAELSLLEVVCARLGEALENARLYEETQRRGVREQQLRQIGARMQSTVDLDAVLQGAVEDLARALGVSSAFVQLYAGRLAPGRGEGAGAERAGNAEEWHDSSGRSGYAG
ncbi:MAG: GAF domain-containing protein [Anaerolineae bacterium]|nr:GAF domain-containing protein [Anaerolineae bacterium]